MPDPHMLALFTGAALVLALMPGPGMFYVIGRTLAAGRAEGYASCFGTMLGGLVHVAAGAFGVSALLMASASAFSLLKIAGGLYLIYLAIRSWRSAGEGETSGESPAGMSVRRAFRQAIVVEATNPKTAAFFLALIPQFVRLDQGHVALQFAVLGCVSVALNTAADLLVVGAASFLGRRARAGGGAVRRVRKASALMMGGIGVYFLLSRRPA
jgi:threonine/homoserine/homoserine lactone efflux protein